MISFSLVWVIEMDIPCGRSTNTRLDSTRHGCGVHPCSCDQPDLVTSGRKIYFLEDEDQTLKSSSLSSCVKILLAKTNAWQSKQSTSSGSAIVFPLPSGYRVLWGMKKVPMCMTLFFIWVMTCFIEWKVWFVLATVQTSLLIKWEDNMLYAHGDIYINSSSNCFLPTKRSRKLALVLIFWELLTAWEDLLLCICRRRKWFQICKD